MDLIWLRGGRWAPDPDRDGSVRLVDPEERTRYRVTARLAGEILNEFARTAWRLDPIAVGLRRRHGEPPASSEAEVVRLLEGVGPLEAAAPPGAPAWALGPAGVQIVTVSVHLAEVRALGLSWVELHTGPKGAARRRLANRVSEYAELALREVEVTPSLFGDTVGYHIEPLSLRARLWEQIFLQFNGGLSRWCAYCGEPFDEAARRGPPFRYCEAHREPRFRRAVSDGRAPDPPLPLRFQRIRED